LPAQSKNKNFVELQRITFSFICVFYFWLILRWLFYKISSVSSGVS
jgi:hypothetical protein